MNFSRFLCDAILAARSRLSSEFFAPVSIKSECYAPPERRKYLRNSFASSAVSPVVQILKYAVRSAQCNTITIRTLLSVGPHSQRYTSRVPLRTKQTLYLSGGSLFTYVSLRSVGLSSRHQPKAQEEQVREISRERLTPPIEAPRRTGATVGTQSEQFVPASVSPVLFRQSRNSITSCIFLLVCSGSYLARSKDNIPRVCLCEPHRSPSTHRQPKVLRRRRGECGTLGTVARFHVNT